MSKQDDLNKWVADAHKDIDRAAGVTNEPTELQKAIEAYESLERVGAVHWSIENIKPLYLAAKQLEAVTKERDELKEDKTILLSQVDNGDVNLEQIKMIYAKQLSTLKSDYKQALEALSGLTKFAVELCEDVKVSTHQHSIEKANKVLSQKVNCEN
jgi:hypothetical protein